MTPTGTVADDEDNTSHPATSDADHAAADHDSGEIEGDLGGNDGPETWKPIDRSLAGGRKTRENYYFAR